MKKLLLVLAFVTTICNAQNSNQTVVGEWITKDFDGNESVMVFTADHFISMTIGAEFIDGKNFMVKGGPNDGQKGLLKYELDATSFPIKIDVIAYEIKNGVPSEKGRLLGILEYLNESEMRINLNFANSREFEFTESNAISTLNLKLK